MHLLSQGSIISCADFDDAFHKLIAERCIDFDKDPSQLKKKKNTPDYYLIVLTQDCDIANSNENFIEFIIGKTSNRNPSLEKGRAYNVLRLPVSADMTLELDNRYICNVKKSDLPRNIAELSKKLTDKNIEILIKWRMARYSRKALPDKFNRVFLSHTWKPMPNMEFYEFFEKSHEYVIDIFVFLNTLSEDEEEYWVSFTALLEPEEICTPEIRIEIESQLNHHIDRMIDRIRDSSEKSLRFCQREDPPSEILQKITNRALSAYPESFSMEDRLAMHPVNLLYLCWPDNGES